MTFYFSILRTSRRNVEGHWRQGSNRLLQILSYKEACLSVSISSYQNRHPVLLYPSPNSDQRLMSYFCQTQWASLICQAWWASLILKSQNELLCLGKADQTGSPKKSFNKVTITAECGPQCPVTLSQLNTHSHTRTR